MSRNSSNHFICCVDVSGSMRESTPSPDDAALLNRFPNRVGAVLQAINVFVRGYLYSTLDNGSTQHPPQLARDASKHRLTIVSFSDNARINVDTRELSMDAVEQFAVTTKEMQRTNYAAALRVVGKCIEDHPSIQLASNDPSVVVVNDTAPLKPVILFMSDGVCNLENASAMPLLQEMKQKYSELVLHAVGAGQSKDFDLLKEMAEFTGGRFIAVGDQLETLLNAFSTMSTIVRNKEDRNFNAAGDELVALRAATTEAVQLASDVLNKFTGSSELTFKTVGTLNNKLAHETYIYLQKARGYKEKILDKIDPAATSVTVPQVGSADSVTAEAQGVASHLRAYLATL